MRRAALAFTGVMLLTSSPSAHRLDEYLQATRVNLARNRVDVEIDLTPGASVAGSVIALIDRDGDNTVTPLEAQLYGRVVIGDVRLELDGAPLALALDRIEVPSMDEMRHGMGTITLRAAARINHPISARPQLHVGNDHQPGSSVYLVNALMPTDAGVSVIRQTRDATQRDARIEYDVRPLWPRQLYWPVLGFVVGGLWLVVRDRRPTRAGARSVRAAP